MWNQQVQLPVPVYLGLLVQIVEQILMSVPVIHAHQLGDVLMALIVIRANVMMVKLAPAVIRVRIYWSKNVIHTRVWE